MSHDLSCYHPSSGETILVQRLGEEAFWAKVTSVTGRAGDYPSDVTLGIERLGGVVDEKPVTMTYVMDTSDKAKADAFAEYQKRLLAWMDTNDRL